MLFQHERQKRLRPQPSKQTYQSDQPGKPLVIENQEKQIDQIHKTPLKPITVTLQYSQPTQPVKQPISFCGKQEPRPIIQQDPEIPSENAPVKKDPDQAQKATKQEFQDFETKAMKLLRQPISELQELGQQESQRSN